MSKTLKLAAATVFGAIVCIAPVSGSLAGPVGMGQSAVAPIELPLENVHWRGCHYGWHCHYYHHTHCCYTRPVRVVETCRGWGWGWGWSSLPASYTVSGFYW